MAHLTDWLKIAHYDNWTEHEITELLRGGNRYNYKLSPCLDTGLIKVRGYGDNETNGYIIASPILVTTLRRDKALRHWPKHLRVCESIWTEVYDEEVYSIYGQTKSFNHVTCGKYDAKTIYNNQIIIKDTLIWEFPTGIFCFNYKQGFVKLEAPKDMIPTALNVGNAYLMPLVVSNNPIGIITFTINEVPYFISAHKYFGFSRTSLAIEISGQIVEVWFIAANSKELPKPYNSKTGAPIDNIIFDCYERVNKTYGQEYVDTYNMTYPDSRELHHLIKVKTVAGSYNYFEETSFNGLLCYIPPASNGRLTKPANRSATQQYSAEFE